MRLVAGVDIGNSTTEVVIAEPSTPPRVVATERAPTRGAKGSAQSGEAAAHLLTRLAHRHGLDVAEAFITPQRPVHTSRIDVPPAPPDLGRLQVLSRGVSTPAGVGRGVGRPVAVTRDPSAGRDEPVVLVAEDPLGFRATSAAIDRWRRSGAQIVGVLLAGDEAALVSARIDASIPIVDCIDSAIALAAEVVALEVAPAGQPVAYLADPLWLVDALSLSVDQTANAAAAAALVVGARAGVVCVSSTQPERITSPAPHERGLVTLRDGAVIALPQARARLAHLPPPAAHALTEPGGRSITIDDLWLVDLSDAAITPGVRATSVTDAALVVSALSTQESLTPGIDAFAAAWGGRFRVLADETAASRTGALSTPGCSPDAWVVDLGGGTLDAVGPDGLALTAAGSGELMTAATKHALGISTGAAEWVKRGPASRVETPHVVSDENGDRRFLDAPAPHGTVGWLVVSGPSGSLPFARTLPLAEWRTLRLALKRQVFADNLGRLLGENLRSSGPGSVIVTGGPAGDDELLEALAPAFDGLAFGRARVAGTLDHRWAVAYGLILLGLDAT